MDEKDSGLDRLCEVYGELNIEDKEKVIRLAEELLETQENSGDKLIK